MHVWPAKHSYAWLPRKCDYQTDTQTDRRTDRHRTKWSLCTAMLCRRHIRAFNLTLIAWKWSWWRIKKYLQQKFSWQVRLPETATDFTFRISKSYVPFTCKFSMVMHFVLILHKRCRSKTTFWGHRSQRLQWPIVITRCLASVVRPSVRLSVVRPLDNLHFQLLLQNRLIDFNETWYGWSTQGPLQVLLFFGQIRPGADPGRGQNRSRGVPFFKELLLQTRRLQQQTECMAVI